MVATHAEQCAEQRKSNSEATIRAASAASFYSIAGRGEGAAQLDDNLGKEQPPARQRSTTRWDVKETGNEASDSGTSERRRAAEGAGQLQGRRAVFPAALADEAGGELDGSGGREVRRATTAAASCRNRAHAPPSATRIYPHR